MQVADFNNLLEAHLISSPLISFSVSSSDSNTLLRQRIWRVTFELFFIHRIMQKRDCKNLIHFSSDAVFDTVERLETFYVMKLLFSLSYSVCLGFRCGSVQLDLLEILLQKHSTPFWGAFIAEAFYSVCLGFRSRSVLLRLLGFFCGSVLLRFLEISLRKHSTPFDRSPL